MDEVTQWEIVASTPQISEFWLLPVLAALLQQFPFVIRGLHSDNGSEFINYTVAKLLDKPLTEQTRSRPHHSGDNGLVESKNGAIIRKHIGYGYIGAQHAEAMSQFHQDYLNPYVNFHRPCAVPTVLTAANGKRRRIYQRWAPRWELFRELAQCERFLRAGVTLTELERFTQLQSDTEDALADSEGSGPHEWSRLAPPVGRPGASKTPQKGNPAPGLSPASVQAHPSMRICRRPCR